MKNTSTQIKAVLENEKLVDSLINASNANPSLEVQELNLSEASEMYIEMRNLLLEALEKGILDDISFNSRNAINSHLQNVQKFINDPNRLIPQLNALQYQLDITDLRQLVFKDLNIDVELKELTALKRRYSKLIKDIEGAEKAKEEMSKIDTNTKELLKSIEKTKTESDEYKKLLSTIQNEIETSKTSIIKSEQDVENKKKEVLEFANNVENTKKSLDQIEGELKTNIEKLLKEKIGIANALIEQAEKALELKSTEGISAAYSSRLSKLSEENSKKNWLYGAIGFVVLTFITGYLLTGGQIDIWKLHIGFEPTENLAFIIGRILLTAIGISGAAFCANRYVQIRNLEEDYEYKVVLSKSILAFANKIKELDPKKTADYLNKVLNDLHQDPLRDRKNKKEKNPDINGLNKISELLRNWESLSE